MWLYLARNLYSNLRNQTVLTTFVSIFLSIPAALLSSRGFWAAILDPLTGVQVATGRYVRLLTSLPLNLALRATPAPASYTALAPPALTQPVAQDSVSSTGEPALPAQPFPPPSRSAPSARLALTGLRSGTRATQVLRSVGERLQRLRPGARPPPTLEAHPVPTSDVSAADAAQQLAAHRPPSLPAPASAAAAVAGATPQAFLAALLHALGPITGEESPARSQPSLLNSSSTAPSASGIASGSTASHGRQGSLAPFVRGSMSSDEPVIVAELPVRAAL